MLQERSLGKLAELRKWIDENKLNITILIDGGINEHTASMVIDAGADILVAGSYLFSFDDLLKGARNLVQ